MVAELTRQEKDRVTQAVKEIQKIIEEYGCHPDDYDAVKCAAECFELAVKSVQPEPEQVRQALKADTNTCYFCGHTGEDVTDEIDMGEHRVVHACDSLDDCLARQGK